MTDPKTDLSRLHVPQLLRLEADIVAELRGRDLVRTSNKPLGDIAERVVWGARGGRLEPNSTKSHDVTTREGRRIQVKAMGGRAAGKSGKFSPFRSFDFDTAVFLVFEPDHFELRLAREVLPGEIETVARLSTHTNSRQPTLRQVEHLGQDVTQEMQAAYATLDAPSKRSAPSAVLPGRDSEVLP